MFIKQTGHEWNRWTWCDKNTGITTKLYLLSAQYPWKTWITIVPLNPVPTELDGFLNEAASTEVPCHGRRYTPSQKTKNAERENTFSDRRWRERKILSSMTLKIHYTLSINQSNELCLMINEHSLREPIPVTHFVHSKHCISVFIIFH